MNIAKTYPAEAKRLRVFLLVTVFLLGVGLGAPIITLNKFMLIENTFSVIGGVVELLSEGKLFLFLVITGFSVLLPLMKINVLYRLLRRKENSEERLRTYLHLMHLYGKWSMLDVFVVAVLVVSVKFGAIANVEVRFGLYSFAAAVVLTMYITARIVTLSREHKGDEG
ncbi:paraquat-inducible protein A [Thiohalomonas denitrificans]|uniref:paraquat-inducible protein A n=1 Tax=Thiohalomonas denitrificans TaxID=415747 RepID=UPI0026ED58A3|nr:paraquat-inducible protein A [Thiohalomonas denitrificans]